MNITKMIMDNLPEEQKPKLQPIKLLTHKTAYIFKEQPYKLYTVLFSYPIYRFEDMAINRHSLPYIMIDEITEGWKEIFIKEGYKLIFRKPQKRTIINMSWTLLDSLYKEYKPIMKLEKPGNEIWYKAIDIYWNLIWAQAKGSWDELPQEQLRFRNMTHRKIYDLLMLEGNNIYLN